MFDDIFSRLDTIHERGCQMDGNRPTAKTALSHSVARQKTDQLVTFAKKVLFSPVSAVCLSVCLSFNRITEKLLFKSV